MNWFSFQFVLLHGGVEHGVAAGAVLVLLQLLQLPVTEDGAVLQDHAAAGRLSLTRKM